jgi:hypothetical protein
MLLVDSWMRGGLDGEMVEDEVHDGDRNRSPEMSLRAVASVTDGLHETGRNRANEDVRKDRGTEEKRKTQTGGTGSTDLTKIRRPCRQQWRISVADLVQPGGSRGETSRRRGRGEGGYIAQRAGK